MSIYSEAMEMDDDKFQARIDPNTAMLIIGLQRQGFKTRDILAAAMDALRLLMARQGKLGGQWKADVLSKEQQGTLAWQKMADRLEESEAFYTLKPVKKPIKEKRRRGRPKKVRPVDPLLAELAQ
jgi:hypothetical protein